MNHLCLLLFAIIIGCSKAHHEPASNLLVGQWTFEGKYPIKDTKNNFGDIQLHGAKIHNGQLDVDPKNWARVSFYNGSSLTEKTLVTWVMLQTTSNQAGSALTIEHISDGDFDAVVYGESQKYHWMAGSEYFNRTLNPSPGYKQTETLAKVQIAITYANDKGNTRVRLYREGELFGDYTKGRLQTYSRGNTEIFWGIRHGSASGGPGHLDALIEESRIYAGVLTPEELKQLKPLCY